VTKNYFFFFAFFFAFFLAAMVQAPLKEWFALANPRWFAGIGSAFAAPLVSVQTFRTQDEFFFGPSVIRESQPAQRDAREPLVLQNCT
jgi:hypothetical protein